MCQPRKINRATSEETMSFTLPWQPLAAGSKEPFEALETPPLPFSIRMKQAFNSNKRHRLARMSACVFFPSPQCKKYKCYVPADVCLNFSLFFFLHFQGLRSLPSDANLLRWLMGGVWAPETKDSERMAASLSTSSAAKETKEIKLNEAEPL